MKVITDNKLKAQIHDRWIISENLCYNIPSTDTVARGQYSEVKETTNKPHLMNGGREVRNYKIIIISKIVPERGIKKKIGFITNLTYCRINII